MITMLKEHIAELDAMKHYPDELFLLGDKTLLERKKVAIVGSRKPNQYAREMTIQLAKKLAQRSAVVVSGGAIGIDAIAHKAAGAENTIMVAATGLDKRYPAINKNLIAEIEQKGLVMSQFEAGTPSQRYNFVLRNELVVALGDVLIVSYADEKSGTMHSVNYAQKMGKKVYVLPHRIGESEGTNRLLFEKQAEAIYDLDAFVDQICGKRAEKEHLQEDEFLSYCRQNPNYDLVLKRYASRLFEAELSGEIVVQNGRIRVLT